MGNLSQNQIPEYHTRPYLVFKMKTAWTRKLGWCLKFSLKKKTKLKKRRKVTEVTDNLLWWAVVHAKLRLSLAGRYIPHVKLPVSFHLVSCSRLVTARRCYWNLLKNEVVLFFKLPWPSYNCKYRLLCREGRRKTTGGAKSVKRVGRFCDQRGQVRDANRFNRWKHIGRRQKLCIGIIV